MKRSILMVLLLLLICVYSAAFAAEGITPSEVSYEETDGVYRAIYSYTLSGNADPADIPTAEFTRGNVKYQFKELIETVLVEYPPRQHTETVTKDSETDVAADVLNLFDKTMEYTAKDGYTGRLTLDPAALTLEEKWVTKSYTVTATRTYPNLADGDISYLPQTVTKNGKTLPLSDVSWGSTVSDYVDGYGTGSLVSTNAGSGASYSPYGFTEAFSVPSGYINVPDSGVVSSASAAYRYTAAEGLADRSGKLGTLAIPKYGVSVSVYEGETLESMKKGIGHFSSTSAWEGNVAFAGHNRGTNAHFGKIKNLSDGDKITYTTALGTRTYEVFSVGTIANNDHTPLQQSGENIITLITCLENTPSLRVCVQAKEVS